jgi:hypothetical protein
LLLGVVTQLCTSEVMSITTNCCACVGVKVATAEPCVGIVAYVTVDSLHELVKGCTLTTPEVLIRFTYSFSVALPIWLAVVPAGSEERSNWISAVPPLPT